VDWSFDAQEPHQAIWHEGAGRTDPWDNEDFHVDLGCGTLKKARIGIDRVLLPGVNIVMTLDDVNVELPFADNSIRSIISHHFLEHCGDGFIPLMDEVWRVLEPGGLFRAITPLFPSWSAVSDADHRRNFMADTEAGVSTWSAFEGVPGVPHWHESFSAPYTICRFAKENLDATGRIPDPALWWTAQDVRELRVALRKP
jgi:SAM-dependent methyltransferase